PDGAAGEGVGRRPNRGSQESIQRLVDRPQHGQRIDAARSTRTGLQEKWRGNVLVQRELEFQLLGVSEWVRASCQSNRGVVPRRFIALAPIPKVGRQTDRVA